MAKKAPEITEEEMAERAEHKRWCAEIRLYEKESESWHDQAKKIIRRYKDEREPVNSQKVQFNILWSNVQTLLPAAYARNPKPDIERRFRDADKLGRVASEVLQRCTAYFVDTPAFGETMRACVKDRLLPGRGTAWVRYKPHFRQMEVQVTEDAEPAEEVYYEEVTYDFVHYDDFGHTVSRSWPEVRGSWRKVYMTRSELEKRFKERGKKVPLDYSPKNSKEAKIEDDVKKASIYEIWDQEKGEVIWLHKDMPEILDRLLDPLRLKDFYPSPKPLLATTANDSLIPVPDFILYQDQAIELDMLTARIAALTRAVKAVGVYDASAPGLEQMLADGCENKLIAVESWAVFAEKGGIKGAVDFLPLDAIANALLSLYEARDKVKQDLYEISGIADIIRGATNAQETATAQQIKGQFATLRLDELQKDVQRFARDLVEITAQIIAEHFSLDTIRNISGVRLMTAQEKQMAMQQAQMMAQTGQPVPSEEQELLDNPTWEEVEQLLRDDAARCFRIDIETDSTIKMDEQQEQEARVEFLTAAGTFMQMASEIGTMNPTMLPLLGRMLEFGARGFKVGKELESTIEATVKKMEQIAANPPPPPPDPAMEKVKQEGEIKKEELAQKDALERDKMANEYRLKEQAQRNEFDLKNKQMDADRVLADRKITEDTETKRQVAEMSQKPTTAIQLDGKDVLEKVARTVEETAVQKAQEDTEVKQLLISIMEKMSQSVDAMTQMAGATLEQAAMTNKILGAERELVRGQDGSKRVRLVQ